MLTTLLVTLLLRRLRRRALHTNRR